MKHLSSFALLLLAIPLAPQPSFADKGPFDIGGERLSPEGEVPPRSNYLTTPFEALLSADELWDRIQRSDHKVIIGIRGNHVRGVFKGKVLTTKAELEEASKWLAEVDGVSLDLEAVQPKMSDGISYPAFVGTISTRWAFDAARAFSRIDFIEPLYFLDGGLSGCDWPTYAPPSPQGPREVDGVTGKGDLISWTFSHLNIPLAWGRFSNTPGGGVKAAVLDTGVSIDQAQLNSRFMLGRPAATLLHEAAPFFDEPGQTRNDTCGHGTRITGLIAAPNDGFNVVGIAPGASLYTNKVGDGVAHTTFSKENLQNGILRAGLAEHADVINMSFGMPYASIPVHDAIVDVFTNTSAVMVAAAGTQVWWVTFPASMNHQVVAATLVDIDSGTGYQKITYGLGVPSVAYGSSVDFAAPHSPNENPTTGKIGNLVQEDISTIGGSSSAAAHVSGVFLLAKAANPGLNRADLIEKMEIGARLFNLSSTDVGHGLPDAYFVTGGTTKVVVWGEDVVPVGESFALEAEPNGTGPFTFQWLVNGNEIPGATSMILNRTAPNVSGENFSVRVTDTRDNAVHLGSKFVVHTGSTHQRTLYSVAIVDEFPNPWGKRVTGRINENQSMPFGCTLSAAPSGEPLRLAPGGGYEYDPTMFDVYAGPSFSPGFDDCVDTACLFGRGYSVSTAVSAQSANDLDADVHVWHDQFRAMRVRVVYFITEPDGVDCSVPGVTQTTP